ncbi:hypothetical protein BJ138DRAFT_1137428 [Hygrophoropsis aurantiaca]|uniref:Uncharacterized protein n=1 Tax=Hygrophoropsis aurantiaca TaxID=72124 RepID=A0ACB8A3A4_9AGAM|nr:hypothetical protein BJ138DRAFT_1137428 [Hygrophoropsis aurantiaca]
MYRWYSLVKRRHCISLYTRAFKLLVTLILLINMRSWPLVWHARLFSPVIKIQLQYCALRAKHIFKPAKLRTMALNTWIEKLCPIGVDPFEFTTRFKGWTSIDDVDFNGHLSNSSYAKTLDFARVESALRAFPAFTRNGGWIGLGSSHYHFVREIPIFTSYEIRTNIGAWDDKWVYVISRFVSLSCNGRSSKSQKSQSRMANSNPHTPPRTHSECNIVSQPERFSGDDIASAAAQLHPYEDDNTTLYCIAISRYCFKHARITVPPSVVLACEGFSAPQTPDIQPRYSQTHPPPHWGQVQRLRNSPHGNAEVFREFLKGGWRRVPESQRWWDAALADPIESRRTRNLGLLKSLSEAMEVAQTL